MSTQDVAEDLVAMCKAGRFEEASAKHHADDVVSIEVMGPPGMDLAARGRKAVLAKSEWWYANHEVQRCDVDGPYVNADRFAVKYTMDLKEKASGKQHHMSEIAVYTVKDDKIVEERFFYPAA